MICLSCELMRPNAVEFTSKTSKEPQTDMFCPTPMTDLGGK
ncbi:unnamed protein product [Gulo gulo]|uniref:Uncharacterized protein n=1 Tax=Gulo gulo TaxID=48420 RepID=A0A9X9LFT5_GULGU|nr:unnamed protein product [Gulo gulo]